MLPVVTPAEMAAVDAAATEPVEVLIGRAGAAAARAALELLGGAYGRRVVVLAGKGNNGNDGRAAARWLTRRGVQVTVLDAAALPEVLPPADLVVDAAYGTGFQGSWTAPRPARDDTPVLAVDIPSGISGLTGVAAGTPLRATATVTFAAHKPGLLLGDGPDFVGRVHVADIGLDVAQPPSSGPRTWLVTAADVADRLPTRPRRTHKWRAAVRLVAGSPGMTGAAQLAATAALRAGAGYVRRSSPGLDPADEGGRAAIPVEAVVTALPASGWAASVLEDLDRFACLAVGPGLGTDPQHRTEVAELVATSTPLVLDGDGLRALGDDPAAVLARRPAGAPTPVLTPHEGEFRRLGGSLGTDDPDFDRIGAVRDLAARLGAVVLLKGPTTIVADPSGTVLLSDTGDQRLASAGTGDVLTGVVAALLAGGVAPLDAAAVAAWVHGRAAQLGPRAGLLAGDLPALVAAVLADPASPPAR